MAECSRRISSTIGQVRPHVREKAKERYTPVYARSGVAFADLLIAGVNGPKTDETNRLARRELAASLIAAREEAGCGGALVVLGLRMICRCPNCSLLYVWSRSD